jgi:hypothetical protein
MQDPKENTFPFYLSFEINAFLNSDPAGGNHAQDTERNTLRDDNRPSLCFVVLYLKPDVSGAVFIFADEQVLIGPR